MDEEEGGSTRVKEMVEAIEMKAVKGAGSDDSEEVVETLETKTEDGLVWEKLGPELVDIFKVRNTWRNRITAFLVTLAMGYLPTLLDMGTDPLSVFNFINGTTYTKYVPNFNHSSVNSSQCTYVGPGDNMTNDNSSSLKFDCFERDPIWGGVSLAFMFVPGLAVWGFCGSEYKKGFNYLTCLALPFFPIALICVKTIALFNPGPNWKILAQRFTVAEGTFESTFQFYLQLFIVFSRADRSPSSVQLLTLATSFLLLIKVHIDGFLMTQPPLDDFWRRCLRVASFLPMLITGQLSDTSLVVLLVTLLRYWALVLFLLLGSGLF